jgi:bifunctional DNA-binding transcriptional regulator/antitoxin component of YhaV-PrlF toxin-antitoxin module
METTLSSKGQIVLPQRARLKLALRPGTKFACKIANGAIVLTPRTPPIGKPKLIRDPSTGLTITKGPANGPTVTSEDVRAMLVDFP